MHRGSWLLIPWLLVAGAGCAKGGTDEEAVQPVDNPVRLEVTNNFALPIEIEAVGSGISHRVGTVHPGMSARFTLPQNLMGSGGVVFIAHPTARTDSFRTDPILLAPGSTVDFSITPQLFNSTATLRP